MATEDTVNISNSGIVYYNGAGNFSGLALGTGKVLIGIASGSPPVAAFLTAGNGISITSTSGHIQIATSGGGFTWHQVTSNTTAVENQGYIISGSSRVKITLPSFITTGIVKVTGSISGTGGWVVSSSPEAIIYGEVELGSIYSTTPFDSITFFTYLGKWVVLNSLGNLKLVSL